MYLFKLIIKLKGFFATMKFKRKKPRKPHSEVVIATEPDDGGLPYQAAKINAEYYIEIFLAEEILEGWLSSFDQKPLVKRSVLTVDAVC